VASVARHVVAETAILFEDEDTRNVISNSI